MATLEAEVVRSEDVGRKDLGSLYLLRVTKVDGVGLRYEKHASHGRKLWGSTRRGRSVGGSGTGWSMSGVGRTRAGDRHPGDCKVG